MLKFIKFILFYFIILSTYCSQNFFMEPNDGRTPILNLINNAQKEIDITIYQLWDNDIEQALINAANNKNIIVKIIYSNIETPSDQVYLDHIQEFCNANTKINCIMSTNKFYLTHQKSILVDQNIAIIMTLNMVDNGTYNYFAGDRDFGIITTDLIDVNAMISQFETDWSNALNQTFYFPEVAAESNVFFSPSTKLQPNSTGNIIFNTLNLAVNSIDIYSENFANVTSAGENLVTILNNLAQSGVIIRIITEINSVTNLDPKISIINVPSNFPIYFHAKSIIIDNGKIATIQSVNFSNSSFNDNREAGIIVQNNISSKLESQFNIDWNSLQSFVKK